MQPFEPFRNVDVARRKPVRPQRLGYAEAPLFTEVTGEIGLVLLVCLGLAVAVTVLVPAWGAS